MKRLLLIASLTLLLTPALLLAQEPTLEQVTGPKVYVYVVAKGKTPLKAEPKLAAPVKGAVPYAQRLEVRQRQKVGEQVRWLQVGVPGEKAEGWILANAVLDQRPSLDHVPVAGGGTRVVASEGSTAGAIRGLDHRTAAYAKDKRMEPRVLAQLAAIEAHGETQFKDRHTVDAKGRWKYADVTAAGRVAAATAFAKVDGLRAPRPPAAAKAAPATPPASGTAPAPAPAPATTPAGGTR